MKSFRQFLAEDKKTENWIIAYIGHMNRGNRVENVNEDKVQKSDAATWMMAYDKDNPHVYAIHSHDKRKATNRLKKISGGNVRRIGYIRADSSIVGKSKYSEIDDTYHNTDKPHAFNKWHSDFGYASVKKRANKAWREDGSPKKVTALHKELSAKHEYSEHANYYSKASDINEYMMNKHSGGQASKYNSKFNDYHANDSANEHVIKGMKETISKNKLHKGIWLHSGISFNPKRFHNEEDGDTIKLHMPTFTSTSISSKSAYNFAHEDLHDAGTEHDGYTHMIHIHANKGAHAYYLGDHSEYKEEREMILHPDAKIHLHATPKINKERREIHWSGKLVHDGIKDVTKPEKKTEFLGVHF